MNGDRVPRRPRLGCAVLGMMLAAWPLMAARAGVSPQDGFAPDGTYQTHLELDVYGWLPATAGNVSLGRGGDVAISQGVPSISELANVLTAAFMGTAMVRYGPWSAVLDIEHVGMSQTTALPSGPFGAARSLTTGTTMTRVAPGIGYQVYNGSAGPMPATLDALAGFAWFGSSATQEFNLTDPSGVARTESLSGSSGMVQPWAGLRGAIYPAPRWRLALSVMVQGFGVNGGIWGWGADFTATWAATKWLNLYAGARALSSGANYGADKPVISIRLLEYGPVLGIGVTF